jgi:predicted  nucleic acid-binding Zn-ribbon protein
MYGIISPYFENNTKQLSTINSLLKEFKSFEIDTKHQKIFLLENDKEEERKKLRKNILKKYFSLEEFSKKRDELNSNLKNSSRRM